MIPWVFCFWSIWPAPPQLKCLNLATISWKIDEKNHTEALHYVKKMSFPVWSERCSHDKILQYKRSTESKKTFLITSLQYILFYLRCPPYFQSCGWCSSTERRRKKEGKIKICKSPWILCLKNPQIYRQRTSTTPTIIKKDFSKSYIKLKKKKN